MNIKTCIQIAMFGDEAVKLALKGLISADSSTLES